MARNRMFAVLGTVGAIALLAFASPVRAGGGDAGGRFGEFCILTDGPEAGLECAPPDEDDNCPEDCVFTSFLPDKLERVCKGGTSKGNPCTTTDGCPNGQCVLKFIATKPMTIHGILTLIVDDDETNFETLDTCVAATVLLEVSKGPEDHLLSQIYVCIPETDSDFEFIRTEAGLNQAVEDASLLDRLLFRRPDGGTNDDAAFEQIAQELRNIFAVTGRPTVVGTPKRIEQIVHTDRESNEVASVVRLKIDIRFTQVAAP